MYFDGASSKEGAGAGVLLISAGGEVISLMYKLEFKTTNNTVDYEALSIGLREAKDLGIKELAMFGDSELVIQQVKNLYQVKQYLFEVYRNEAWDLIENIFIAYLVSDSKHPNNHPIYSIDENLSSCMLQLSEKWRRRVPAKG